MYPSAKNPDYGIFVKNIKEELSERGLVFNYVSVIKGRSVGIKEKVINYLKYYFSIGKNYLLKDYDVIYVHFLSHNAPILYLLVYMFGYKKPLIVNVHGSDVLKYNDGIFKFFNKKILRKTNLLVVPSLYFKEVVEDKFPFLDQNKIYVYPSGGVDLSVFSSSGESYKYRKNHLTLGFVSRIEENKGWKTFIEGLSLLKKEGIEFTAIIAGKGLQSDELREIIGLKSYGNHVEYIGAVPQSELAALYNKLDLFVFPTYFEESLGLVAIEAMACGVPVIASDLGGPKRYVNDEINGYLFEPKDAKGLVRCILKYNCLDLVQKEQMKQEALKTAFQFGSKRVNDKMFLKFIEFQGDKTN
ncbi:glycosyltransferase [Sinomicrobium oceani]|uniref:glycosyltransferase n=1 Tax=Sinomicrobium oceani TaxID=1150368 RepID=UPI00227C1AA4|nr:glycosyltransferase [Sinomicrobium oceani]